MIDFRIVQPASRAPLAEEQIETTTGGGWGQGPGRLGYARTYQLGAWWNGRHDGLKMGSDWGSHRNYGEVTGTFRRSDGLRSRANGTRRKGNRPEF